MPPITEPINPSKEAFVKSTRSSNIVCDNVDLWGKVEGNIFVKDTLSLKEGCVVNGNLHIKKLAVELGSTFNGNCRMISESEFDKLSGVQTVVKPVQQHQHQAPAN